MTSQSSPALTLRKASAAVLCLVLAPLTALGQMTPPSTQFGLPGTKTGTDPGYGGMGLGMSADLAPLPEAPSPYLPPGAGGPGAGFPTTAPGAGTAMAGPAPFQPDFGPGLFAATGGGELAIADNAGYIDSAIIRSRIRLRYDTSYGLNQPSRAEFFYPACGCLRLFGVNEFARGPIQNTPFRNFVTTDINGQTTRGFATIDPALGPNQLRVFPLTGGAPVVVNRGDVGPGIAGGGEPNIDYQEVTPYIEFAPLSWFSVFAEMPTRFINPTLVENASGFSDLNLGFKAALIANYDTFITFQFRTYVPTGSATRGLGTGNAALEPGLLVFHRLAERLYFHGEVRDWIAIPAATNPDPSLNFAGNVLRYGAGLSYNLLESANVRVAPVAEFVGWTVLNGNKLGPFGIEDAEGDTIVNAKFGVRLGLGQYLQPGGGTPLNDRHSFYAGYGRALTGDHWYRDTMRLEYQFLF